MILYIFNAKSFMGLFFEFYNNILNKKKFYIPVLLFALIGYSFSIYSRTVSDDDLLRDFYIGDGGIMLSGRWGMVFWTRLLGLTEFDPFIDRFLALSFYVIASVLLCYLFYTIDRSRNIIPYTLLASFYITYPLFNEIWEYCVANFAVSSGACIASIVVLIIRSNWARSKKVVVSGILMIFPMSTYESAIFYYIALVCVVIFYENYVVSDRNFSLRKWINENIIYYAPLLIAVCGRFIVSFVINSLYNLSYDSGGSTEINWLRSEDVWSLFLSTINSNIFYYIVSALVYFPISIFVIMMFLFIVILINNREKRLFFLGGVIVVATFLQAIIQGGNLPYRHAQTVTLFVSFVAYMIAITRYRYVFIQRIVFVGLFVLCWHQAVYVNRILGLNNLRSNNEADVIRKVGYRLTSEYDKKPVVFVSPYKINKYIDKQVTVDETTWNGKLFNSICNKMQLERPYKYVVTNVNCATAEYHQIQGLFSYFGYDINVIMPINNSDKKLFKEALYLAKRIKMMPYQIFDQGDYIIVKLGEELFPEDGVF